MEVCVRPYQLVIQVLASLLLGDVKAYRGPLKPVSMFASCGDEIEVFQHEAYRLDILGAVMSDLRSECEVKFYGRRRASVYYLVKNVKNNAERVVVYIKIRPRDSDPEHYITKETIDYAWRNHKGQSELTKPASGGTSTIIKTIRSSRRSRDFSMTVEIYGEDYNKPVDPDAVAKRIGMAVGIIAALVVGCVCAGVLRSLISERGWERCCAHCRNHHRGRRESPPPINVPPPTVSSHQYVDYVPTLPPIQRNPNTGNIEPYSGGRDASTDLLGARASNPHQAQSGQSRHSQRWDSNLSLNVETLTSDNRRDDDPPAYYTTLSRALTPQLAITAPDDCLPTYGDALKLESSV